jgi:phage FluMu protein Com
MIVCESCNGIGIVHSNNEQNHAEIQKCDDCNIFKSDAEAQTYVKQLLLNFLEATNESL